MFFGTWNAFWPVQVIFLMLNLTSHRQRRPPVSLRTANPAPACTTLVELLRHRATIQPDEVGITFLLDGERDEVSLTYAQLDRRARAIASWLQDAGAQGERALLLY